MKREKCTHVIAIASVSGGGKTTISTQLTESLQSSKILYFDNYDFEGPVDIIDWVDRGANYDEWNLTPLIKDLEGLLNESLDYIVLDYPFAYKHTKMSKYIDSAFFIDTPLDVAMARRVTRDFKHSTGEDIILEMKNYISYGRRGYLEMLKTIKANSDFIVDGALPILDIVNVISKKLGELNSK
ncbi:hypothetical protein KGR20_22870 [Cytobacillus oceanisediminis]|uniref:Phosphoribulokinase/uridine kinase domain-containing protein n=2 Tax=Niallia TaxID=2837506 RepID=A0A941GP61_NIACI|nr:MULTISPECIES: hypothetical protein [Bacillaceae]MBQ6449243.1 hypothetical protein [Bacillus sp. (in: firmicutes)]MDU1847439.1 hypothetical protein [Niallia nealsonii]MBZ9537004.1 hypothetical protein [Cytobacillus oceanisediminis]MCB5238542.1 hypothetical protein [Niallia circulans]MED3795477.1 hypothetical protein [Niallia alba]